jgi:YidC/Oxa1 family membrane protein insertase
MNILIAPFVNALFGFYYITHNLGWSVVIVTVLIRMILLPLVLPSLKSAKKMRELQPKLKKLQEKYKGKKEELAKAQMDLYRTEGINPLSGCLPQLAQVAVLIIFFSAFNMVTDFSHGKGTFENLNKQLIPSFQIDKNFKFDTGFLGTNLANTPAKAFSNGIDIGLVLPMILLLGSGVLQYFSAKMMMPTAKTDEAVLQKENKDKEDDMMSAMRTQSTYMMPLMTIFIGWNFSLGILLYWFVNSAVMLGQQVMSEKMAKS